MKFKVDSDKLKLWRKERAWSQEKMAEKAGVSLRTIQRIENGGVASHESAIALADVLAVDVKEFMVDEDIQSANEAERQKSKGMMGFKMSVGIHAVSFAMVSIMLLIIDFIDYPTQWWSIIPLAFWGVGLVGHAGAYYLVQFIEKTKQEMQELESTS